MTNILFARKIWRTSLNFSRKMFPDFIDTSCFLEAYLCILNALIFRKLCKPGVEFKKFRGSNINVYIYIYTCDISKCNYKTMSQACDQNFLVGLFFHPFFQIWFEQHNLCNFTSQNTPFMPIV